MSLPLQSINADREFAAAVSSAVMVDRSIVGKLQITGAEGLDLLHRLSANGILSLNPWESRSTVFTTDKGRIVDYARLLRTGDSTLLRTSPLGEERLKAWIDKYTLMEDIQVTVVTSDWSEYSVLGPEAKSTVEKFFGLKLTFNKLSQTGLEADEAFIDLHNEFGFDCVDLLLRRKANDSNDPDGMEKLSRRLEIPLMSADAYETFRIFHGVPGENHELTVDFNPYEVGLEPFISFTKGCYIGQEVIARLSSYDKVQRKLVRLSFEESVTTNESGLALLKDGEAVGIVSSIAPLTVSREHVGLGVVRRKVVKGEALSVMGADHEIKCVVTEDFERVQA